MNWVWIFGKASLDASFPYVGIAVDAGSALYELINGNYSSCAAHTISAVMTRLTVGTWNSAQTVASASAKDATIAAIKRKMVGLPPEVTKKAGQQLSKDIAKGAIKVAVDSAAEEVTKKTAASVGGKLMLSYVSNQGSTVTRKTLEAAVQYSGEALAENAMKRFGSQTVKTAFTHAFTEAAAKEASIGIMKNANTACIGINISKACAIGALNKYSSE